MREWGDPPFAAQQYRSCATLRSCHRARMLEPPERNSYHATITMRCSLGLLSAALLSSLASAQLPTPNPIPRVKPRAHWVLTPSVTGTPTQRRDNPGAASESKLYVFGGRAGNATSSVLNALYEFDGKAWTLKTAEGAVGSPPKRGGAAVAWDFGRKKLVVFGGDAAGSPVKLLADTWEWDPTSNKWTQLSSKVSPSARRWSAMAWDPISKGMVLFGGLTAAGYSDETWVLVAGQWTKRTPSSKPPARSNHSMMTRRDYKDIVLVAGQDNSKTPKVRHLDVWRWLGATWIQLPTNKTNPHGCAGNQAVYDESRKRIVLQGGNGISTYGGATLYGKLYGGSPSSWRSEYACVSNRWLLCGPSSFSTADPVIGRISRYFAGYIAALGKVYKVSGQNPSGTGTITGTCEYQATPVATAATLGKGCQNLVLAGVFPKDRPWLGRTLDAQVTGLATGSLALGLIGFKSYSIPLKSIFSVGGAGCTLYSGFDITLPLSNTGGKAMLSLPLPSDVKFAGAKIYEQVLQFQFSGSSLSSFTASNGLTLTLGAL